MFSNLDHVSAEEKPQGNDSGVPAAAVLGGNFDRDRPQALCVSAAVEDDFGGRCEKQHRGGEYGHADQQVDKFHFDCTKLSFSMDASSLFNVGDQEPVPKYRAGEAGKARHRPSSGRGPER